MLLELELGFGIVWIVRFLDVGHGLVVCVLLLEVCVFDFARGGFGGRGCCGIDGVDGVGGGDFEVVDVDVVDGDGQVLLSLLVL